MDKKKQQTLFIVLIVLLSAILIGVIVLIVSKYTGGAKEETTEVVEETGKGKGKSGKVHELKAFAMNDPVTNAVTLKPQYGNHYEADCLFDDRRSTAWTVGTKEYSRFESGEGSGVAPYVNIGFTGKEVTYAMVRNGYGKSTKHFKMNARPQALKVEAYKKGSDTPVGTLYEGNLKDTNSPQKINFKSLDKPYDYVRFIVDKYSVYPGYKYDDICIDEITLYGK